MRLLIPVLLLSAFVLVAFLLGRKIGKQDGRYEANLDVLAYSAARHELQEWRNLGNTLTIQASTHSQLGEPFATIVLDELNKTRIQIEAPLDRKKPK